MSVCEKCGQDTELRFAYGRQCVTISGYEQERKGLFKSIVTLQKQLIATNQQLIEAQEKLLNPLVEVKTATELQCENTSPEREPAVHRLDRAFLESKKYKQIVEAFRRVESAKYLGPHGQDPGIVATVFVDTVRMILGDDVNVERVPEGEYPRAFSTGELGVPGIPGKPGEVKR